jgi:glutamate dehydrogenase
VRFFDTLEKKKLLFFHRDKIIALVDGAGVLFDGNGLDRNELHRLAKLRKPCHLFDRSKLSPKGFLMLLEDKNVKLFTGEV